VPRQVEQSGLRWTAQPGRRRSPESHLGGHLGAYLSRAPPELDVERHRGEAVGDGLDAQGPRPRVTVRAQRVPCVPEFMDEHDERARMATAVHRPTVHGRNPLAGSEEAARVAALTTCQAVARDDLAPSNVEVE